jgi:hypothetical protein
MAAGTDDQVLNAYRRPQGFPTTFATETGGTILSKIIGAQPGKSPPAKGGVP